MGVTKYVFGFLSCALVMGIIFVCYEKVLDANTIFSSLRKEHPIFIDSVQENVATAINNITIKEVRTEEQILSINKRFDDLYILGGTIVVLLIAINIGIFVRTEDEIESYFNKHFKEHQDKIITNADESVRILGRLNGLMQIAQNINRVQQQGQGG